MGKPASIDSNALTRDLKSFRCNTYKKHGGPKGQPLPGQASNTPSLFHFGYAEPTRSRSFTCYSSLLRVGQPRFLCRSQAPPWLDRSSYRGFLAKVRIAHAP